jgi:hypothetical protein
MELLLKQANVDDTMRNEQGRTCEDVVRNKEVLQGIQGARLFSALFSEDAEECASASQMTF